MKNRIFGAACCIIGLSAALCGCAPKAQPDLTAEATTQSTIATTAAASAVEVAATTTQEKITPQIKSEWIGQQEHLSISDVFPELDLPADIADIERMYDVQFAVARGGLDLIEAEFLSDERHIFVYTMRSGETLTSNSDGITQNPEALIFDDISTVLIRERDFTDLLMSILDSWEQYSDIDALVAKIESYEQVDEVTMRNIATGELKGGKIIRVEYEGESWLEYPIPKHGVGTADVNSEILEVDVNIIKNLFDEVEEFENFVNKQYTYVRVNDELVFLDADEEYPSWAQIEPKFTLAELKEKLDNNYTGSLHEYYSYVLEERFVEQDGHLYTFASESGGSSYDYYPDSNLVVLQSDGENIEVEFDGFENIYEHKTRVTMTLKFVDGKWKISNITNKNV